MKFKKLHSDTAPFIYILEVYINLVYIFTFITVSIVKIFLL